MRLSYTSVPEDSAHSQAFEVPVIKDDDRRVRPTPLDVTTPTSPPPKQRYSLDRLFLQRLLRIIRLLFAPSPQGFFSRESRDRSVLWLYIAFVGISCLNEVIVYFVGMIPSRFYKVLVDKDAQGFGALVIPTILLIAAAAVGKSLVKFMGGLFSLKIRRLLTEYLQNRFIQTNIFYRLLVMHESIDNPDQRITQDVDKFADTSRAICEDLIISPLLIIYYTYQCWRVGGLLGPLLIYSYFAIGSFSSRAFISPIVNVVFLKEFHEGNFRFLHIRLRQFAESIAFSRGEKEENVRLERSLNALLSYQRSIINRELPLQFVTEGFSYFGSILSYLIIAIPIFAGRYDDKDSGELSGLISQSAFLSLYLIYRFTLIIEQSAKISDLAGYTARIGQLIEAISDIHSELENIDIDFPYQEDQAASNICIKFENVAFNSPTGKPILTNLNLVIERDTNWMIVGPNGSGKTSLLRVMGGLWPCKGRVVLPTLKTGREIIFLPQTPYLLFGSLRAQITYPSIESATDISDSDLKHLLECVGLSHLIAMVESFDTPYGQDWYKMMSPGEQQKLAFARVFYWKPLFAVLDEATSAMDSVAEASLFAQARGLGISLITVGHDAELLRFHDRVLVLDGKGEFMVKNIMEEGLEAMKEMMRKNTGEGLEGREERRERRQSRAEGSSGA